MTVLDAYAVIAALAGERAAKEVERLLRDPDGTARLCAVNLSEVHDQMVRVQRHSEADVRRAMDLLVLGRLDVVPFHDLLARDAGEIRARRYRRDTAPLSLADCCVIATGADLGEAIATSDPALAAAAEAEGVDVIGLPDTRGVRP